MKGEVLLNRKTLKGIRNVTLGVLQIGIAQTVPARMHWLFYLVGGFCFATGIAWIILGKTHES